jgi:lipoprotein-releasing system permease protein
VRSVEPFVTKPALLKTDEDFLAVAVKGVDGPQGEAGFFGQYLREGQGIFADEEADDSDADETAWAEEDADAFPSNDVLLSRSIASRLRLAVGDDVQLYFIRTDGSDEFAYGSGAATVKSRRVRVAGIYESHFEEYDRQIVAADMRLLQQVGEWHPDQVSGLELRLTDFDALDDAYALTADSLMAYAERSGELYYLRTVRQMNPQIFGWLDLLDTNVWVILILIASVAAFTMISGLLIIILERTRMIGILKALGYDNGGLRRVFLYVALFLTGKGLIWGNVVGLALCWVQSRWHLLRLDPENYYLEWVPIALRPWHVIGLNIATVLLTLLVLIGPSAIIAKISPTKAIQAD